MSSLVTFIESLPGGEWLVGRATPLAMMSILLVSLPATLIKSITDPTILSSWKIFKEKSFAVQWLLIGETIDKMFRKHKVEFLKEYVGGNIVVDLGTGSGINLKYYDSSKIGKLICIEPNADLHEKLRNNAKAAGFVDGKNLQICGFGAEDSEKFYAATGLGDESVDCVVSLLALCGIPRPQTVIDSLYQKLKPGSYFVFFEHVLSDESSTARYQNLLNPIWRQFMNGCELNRPTHKRILDAHEWQEKKLWGIGESKYAFSPKSVGFGRK